MCSDVTAAYDDVVMIVCQILSIFDDETFCDAQVACAAATVTIQQPPTVPAPNSPVVTSRVKMAVPVLTTSAHARTATMVTIAQVRNLIIFGLLTL